MSRGYRRKSGGYIIQNIFYMFTSDTESNEAVADCIATPARAPLGARMHPTKAGRLAHERQRSQELFCSLTGTKIEAHDSAEPLHLPRGDFVA